VRLAERSLNRHMARLYRRIEARQATNETHQGALTALYAARTAIIDAIDSLTEETE
jgi:hypothetical protein